MSCCFTHFYENWFEQLRHLVHQLSSAPKSSTRHNLLNIVDKVMSHYTEYYRVKSLAVEHDALSVFNAPWATNLERCLQWIAGWRPTTTFHLVYSESCILLESRVVDIPRGQHTGDLGDLSPAQFRRVSELRCETVKEENEITEEFSDWQDDASEQLGVSADFDARIGRLVTIIKKADDLRVRTMKNVLELLTLQQAAEFLIAAAEFQFGVRGWGMNQDSHRGPDQ